jgi:hypothetical protein
MIPHAGVGLPDISFDFEPTKGYGATQVGWYPCHTGIHQLLEHEKCRVYKPVSWEGELHKQLQRVSSWWRNERKYCN